jgi:bifunctional non-homologous end joining protein LigD
MRSRHGRVCADEFPEVAALAETLTGRWIVLDGELVCSGRDGKPDFAALRARFGSDGRALSGARRRSLLKLIVFDVLHLDGRAVGELPYCERRELLEELALDGPAWCTPRHILGGGEGEALIGATAAHGLEGVVAKRLDAAYMAGRRSTAWIKHKHRRREWFVITGWRERPGMLPEFLLARRRGADLVPAGSASLGLDADQRAELIAALSDRELPDGPRRGQSAGWIRSARSQPTFTAGGMVPCATPYCASS